jgi:hypothetical protein
LLNGGVAWQILMIYDKNKDQEFSSITASVHPEKNELILGWQE